MNTTTTEAARDYARAGLFTVPIPARAKRPVIKKWEQLRILEADVDQHYNGHPQNVGVLLGVAQEGVVPPVDVDKDVPEAVALAPLFLPSTRTFGRPGNPSSHSIYHAADRRETTRYQIRIGTKLQTIVEYRDTSAKGSPVQTVFPGSTHESGELITWDGEPGQGFALVDASDLFARVQHLAAASVLLKYYPRGDGGRHDAAGALASVLARSAVADRTVEIVRAFALLTGDEEVDDRVRFAEDTIAAIASGMVTTGAPRLLEMLAPTPEAEKNVRTALDWLGFEGKHVLPFATSTPTGDLSTAHDVKPIGEFKMTDLGNAERLAHVHGDDVMFCHPWESWMEWTGQRWAEDKSGAVPRRSYEMVRRMQADAVKVEDDAQRSAALKWATSSQSGSRLRSMLTLAQNMIPVMPEQFDDAKWLLNVENGTIDLRTGRARPHDRADMITKLAPVVYDPAATAPRWKQLLSEVFGGDEDLAAFFQRAVGYSLTGDTREQCIVIAYGHGANGKGTTFGAIQQILGGYAQSMRPDLLMAKRHSGGASEGEAALRGARFVVTSETSSGQRFDEALVKRLTGSDTIRARFLHANEFEFEPTHKIWLATNHKPAIEGTDHAIWRRIHLLPFTVTFSGESEDKTLSEKLKSELPGILNWALAGCLEWQRNGLQPPAAVTDATSQYRSEMDILAGFLSECCDTMSEMSVKADRLYQAYDAWCTRSGEKPDTRTKFGMQVKERGVEKIRKADGYHYKGLGLKGGHDVQ